MDRKVAFTSPDCPYLKSIGSIQLVHAKGPEADRSQLQLMQILIWIMEHPGRKGSQMSNHLAIAEGTRRSYLCKLRQWLGTDEDGRHYLPYAHSQRVWLSPLVQWDIHDVMHYLGTKPEENDDDVLIAALEKIRGPVFADVARGEWRWAEPLRIYVTDLLSNAAQELKCRALRNDDIARAMWATQKILMIAPWDGKANFAFQKMLLDNQHREDLDVSQFIDGDCQLWNQRASSF